MSLCGDHGALQDTLSSYEFAACQETDLSISHEPVRWLVFTYLSDYLRWLSVVNGFEVLLHSSIIVLLGVQVVAKLAKDAILLRGVQACLLGQVNSQNVQVALVQYVKLLRKRFLMISENLNVVSSESWRCLDIIPFHQS